MQLIIFFNPLTSLWGGKKNRLLTYSVKAPRNRTLRLPVSFDSADVFLAIASYTAHFFEVMCLLTDCSTVFL